ncbi:MAG: preprotein translocase subunit SecG [Sphingobacteriia bacterium]|nr:preprotein translocase subunit SecG [Sphingobacteriia bacterium]
MGILIAIHVLVTIFLILIVLIQKNEGGSSLFASSGGTGGMFNARGVSNILTKITWILATIFLANCVLMASLDSSKIRNAQTLVEKKSESEKVPEKLPQTPKKKN